LLDAICVAPSARGWAASLVSFEVLLLRELGYGVPGRPVRQRVTGPPSSLPSMPWAGQLERYLLAERRSDVMAARAMLRTKLARIEGN
jgi:DNA repair protein RecO (recombination protein O)